MDKVKAKRAKVLGYVCLGLSIVCIVLYFAKWLFAADSDVSPALPIVGIALLIVGVAAVKKASQG